MSILVIVIANVVSILTLAYVRLAILVSSADMIVDYGDDMFTILDSPTETNFSMQKNERIQEKPMKRNYALCGASTAKKEVVRVNG